jgi:hypothetical protein
MRLSLVSGSTFNLKRESAMDAIRIENLRSIKDSGLVDIKKINILVGSNSSGKSSFVRCFPMLRQSCEANRVAPFLWWGSWVDFGMISDVISKVSDDKEVRITLYFDLKEVDIDGKPFSRDQNTIFNINRTLLKGERIKVVIGVSASKDNKGASFASSCIVEVLGHVFVTKYFDDGRLSSFLVNGEELIGKSIKFSVKNGYFLPKIYIDIDHRESLSNMIAVFFNKNFKFEKVGMSYLDALVDVRTGVETKRDILSRIEFTDRVKMVNNIRNINSTLTWNKNIKFDKYRDCIDGIINTVAAASYLDLQDVVNKYFEMHAKNVYYLDPIRANAERYYRPQEYSVDFVDSKGKNLPLLLNSLTRSERERLDAWTSEHFGFTVFTGYDGGHITVNVKIEKEKVSNIADMGFGYSQVLPIIVQLWRILELKKSSWHEESFMVLAIEQPELHLHPKMQAQLADVFLTFINSAEKLNIDARVIIETHSEAIVNRIGLRIARKDFSKEDVGVLLFTKHDGVTSIDKSGYDSDGFLENWPLGFLDAEGGC